MATPITNNVIKISSQGVITLNNVSSEYPRTCDFCRDTYNSELTFKRHKETGKCFRFCRLREETPAKYKSFKPRMYPRICERCLKTYKNKHSYYKHKTRCTLPPSASVQNQVSDVDVVELSNDDIDNIPVTDNKENINDFDSKFILAIDVEEERENYDSLYPRICEFCHKAYKCKRSFANHRFKGHCAGVKKGLVGRTGSFSHKCEKCLKSFRMKNQLIAHVRRCSKSQLVIVPQVKKIDDFQPLPTTSVQTEESTNDPLSIPTSKLTREPILKKPVQSLYPRECKRCCIVYNRKQNFYRHKKWCFPDLKAKSGSIYPRTCEFCGFTFSVKHTFHRHKNKCPGYAGSKTASPPLKCEPCDRTFQNVVQQAQHMKFIHPTSILPTYPRVCDKCGNSYLSRQTYCNHKRRCCPGGQEKPDKCYQIICSKCSLSFSSRSLFVSHRRICNPINDPVKDSSIYPRECEFCKNTYSSKQAFYRHKDTCEAFVSTEPTESRSYPRVCEHCRRIYSTRQSFYAHKSRCTGRMTALLKQEIEDENHNGIDSDLNTEFSSQNATIEVKPTTKSTYPKMCLFCRKIYANQQTFCRHKLRCVPVPPIEEIIHPGQPDDHTYPRECNNCAGTFKCAETFEAHKIRCDFFEPINDSDTKIISQSNCEHCRNILGQYRRIFHQHLKQCTNPVIISREQLQPLPKTEPLSPPSFPKPPQNAIPAESMEFVNCTANFCECCGVFFDSILQLEEHKHLIEQAACLDVVISDLNPNTCDICREVFENEQEFDSHRLKCIVNSAHKTYPRFCECCQKIYRTKQSFYNHKKNCHVYCFKYFVEKDCESCMLPFKCEIKFLEHKQTCPRIDKSQVDAEEEVLLGP